MRLEILAAHDELVRLLGAIQRSKPDLAVLDVSDGSARRNIRRMPGIDSFRLAACPRNSPNGLFCACGIAGGIWHLRSEEHTSELQSRFEVVCRLLLEKKKRE